MSEQTLENTALDLSRKLAYAQHFWKKTNKQKQKTKHHNPEVSRLNNDTPPQGYLVPNGRMHLLKNPYLVTIHGGLQYIKQRKVTPEICQREKPEASGRLRVGVKSESIPD